jgi:hypothetical protein
MYIYCILYTIQSIGMLHSEHLTRQAMPTEQPVTGSTEAPSAEGLKSEKAAVEAEMARDEQEMEALQEEETAAAAVDAEIDGVQVGVSYEW